MEMIDANLPIWGEFSLPEDLFCYWKIGPLELWSMRTDHEIFLYHQYSRNLSDPSIVISQGEEAPPPPPDLDFLRFYCHTPCTVLEFVPVFPDRSVVVRPASPFHILSGERGHIYLSIGLWLKCRCKETKKELFTIPILQLSDTWFGDNPTRGEICYSAKTVGRIHLEKLLLFQYRFIAKLEIINKTKKPLNLERVKVPPSYLNLYENLDGLYITDSIFVKYSDTKDHFKIWSIPPDEKDFGSFKKTITAVHSMDRWPLAKTISKFIN